MSKKKFEDEYTPGAYDIPGLWNVLGGRKYDDKKLNDVADLTKALARLTVLGFSDWEIALALGPSKGLNKVQNQAFVLCALDVPNA